MHHQKALLTLVFLCLNLAMVAITIGQTDLVPPPDPQTVEISAVDGLTLVGSYYALPDSQSPTVLLLHELNASREEWALYIEPLWTAGYNVLAVDLRGHGETGGGQNLEAAVGDVQIWLDWLQEQPGAQTSGISVIGAD